MIREGGFRKYKIQGQRAETLLQLETQRARNIFSFDPFFTWNYRLFD
jgi:hypothetical protein